MRPRLPSAVAEGLLFSLLIFGPFAFGAVEPWSRAVLETLAFLTALACFLRGREAATPFASAAWLFPAGVALLACAQALAAVPADGPRPPWPFTSALHETEGDAVLWAAYACVVYAVPRVVATTGAARRFARLFFYLGLAVGALGLLQAATSKDLIYWTRPTMPDVPPFGPYYNRDHAANLMLMSLAVGAGLLWSRVSRWSPGDGPAAGEARKAGLEAAGVLALFGCIALCNSRGALLALSLSAGAMLLAASGFASTPARRRAWAAAGSAAVALAIFCVFVYVRSDAAAGALLDRSVRGRLTIYRDCVRWLRDSPLFGTGLGSFASVYPSYQNETLRGIASHAHSDWLEFLLETGALGAFLALVAGAAFLVAALGAWRRAKSREMRALIGGALFAVFAFAAHALFEFGFQIPANAAAFFALQSFLLSAPAWADKSERVPAADPPELAPALAGGACFVFAAWAALSPAAANWSAGRIDRPGERLERLRGAARRDDDPEFAEDLSREAYRLAVESPQPNPVFLRAALSYALDAAAARPYDEASLYLAGASLWRLRRFDDAKVFLDREKRVSFAPDDAATPEPRDWNEQRLDMLKKLQLVPNSGVAR
jgi:O-antigen ligase